jgi:ribulose bisphosphate carboxylase small subunit
MSEKIKSDCGSGYQFIFEIPADIQIEPFIQIVNHRIRTLSIEHHQTDNLHHKFSGKTIYINDLVELGKVVGIFEKPILTDITKEQAYALMEKGHKIAHDYYTDNEFLIMKDGVIDEWGHRMGTKNDEFWSKIQKWETGWKTYN